MVVGHVNVKAIFREACGIVAGSISFQKDIKRYLMKCGKLIASVIGAVMIFTGTIGSSVMATSRDAGSIIIDGKTFSANRNCKGDTWKYDAKTRTLSLDGYNGMYIDLSEQEDAKIEVIGDSTVVSNIAAPAIQVEGSLTITGEGKLKVEVTACHSAIYAKNGSLTIDHCNTLAVSGHGAVSDSAYLLMADDDITISGSYIPIGDEIDGNGGAVGSLGGDILINDGTILSIFSRTKGLASITGGVRIEGEDTSAEVFATESALYGKTGISISGAENVRAESSKPESTAMYCPEGNITIEDTFVDIFSAGAAMAGMNIEIKGGYISDPFDGEIKEVSGMNTVTLEGAVVKEVHILTGVKPTPTPTPSPTPTPLPTPTPSPTPSPSAFSVTPRMMIGGGMIVVALIVFAVIIVGKIRGRDE